MNDSTALAQAKQGGLVALTALNNPFKQAAKKEGVTDGFWLRMNGSTGAWLTNLPGQTELADGTELVFNMWSAEKVWLGFDKANKLHPGPKVSIASGQELPDPPQTPGVEWNKSIRVMVATTDGGQQMMLTCKANNEYREIWKLINRYGDLCARFPDPTAVAPPGFATAAKMPIVKIGSRGYDMVSKKEEVVTDAQGNKKIEMVEKTVHPFSDTLTISYDENDWISEADMLKIREAAGLAPPSTAGTDERAKVAPAKTTVEEAAALTKKEPEIILPGRKVPDAGAAGFRRNRVGGQGARTG